MSSQGLDPIIEAIHAQIDAGTIEVPMLPDIAQKVLQLANDPDSSAAQLAKLIQSDQSLAGHVMHIANSAAYSPQSTLVSLQQAIARLGLNQVSDIALAASISSEAFSAPGFEDYCRRVWRHALLTGLWAKEIARVGRRNVEAVFLCGLLHSIGRPLSLQLILKAAPSLSAEQVHSIEEHLQHPLTTYAVSRWKLPEIITVAVTHYLDFTQAKIYSEQAATVAAAARFAHYCETPDDKELEALNEQPELAHLNLYIDEIEGLLEQQQKVTSSLDSFSV